MGYRDSCLTYLVLLIGLYGLTELVENYVIKTYSAPWAALAPLLHPLAFVTSAIAFYELQNDPDYKEDYKRQIRELREMGIER